MIPSQITFEVRSCDIRLGKPNEKFDCPLACGIERDTEAGSGCVQVGDEGVILVWIDDAWRCYDHTKKTDRFRRRFDCGQRVRPDRFRIRRSSPAKRAVLGEKP